MKLAICLGEFCLSFRKTITFGNLWSDPRGLTGSELGFVRIAQELKRLGHAVELFTVSPDAEWEGMPVRHVSELKRHGDYDAVISVNEPDLLREANAKLRVCLYWLNDSSFCRRDWDQHVDLCLSPSEAHLEQVFTNDAWRDVEVTPESPRGTYRYTPDRKKWGVVRLGCDPERFEQYGCRMCAVGMRHDSLEYHPKKPPGRVIYSSSPDRGLHWLLQEWPAIKRAVPHATLRIFYRLTPWIAELKRNPYFHPIEALRARALFIEEALTRFAKEPDGMGVEVYDSVSRERIEREMAEAECMAYPVDTTVWSEGFSCSTLEGCAARAVPVIFDTDALGSIYRDATPVVSRGSLDEWRDTVIRVLTDEAFRTEWADKGARFGEEHTWAASAKRIETLIKERLDV